MQASRLEVVAKEFDKRANIVPNVDFDGYMKARDIDKANVKSADQFRAEVIALLKKGEEEIGATMPWAKTYSKFRFRPGEVTVWMGFNGSMKSLLTGYIGLDLIAQGEKVCVASFEMKPRTSLSRMIPQSVGSMNPTDQYIDKFFDWSKDSLWFYDQHGTVNPDRIIAVIHYCADKLGITHFFIDSLMKCIADEDDMNGQKRFVDKLCAAAQDLSIHIHLIHHSRKKESEKIRPNKQDAKGSGSIADQTDNFIVIFKVPEETKKQDETQPDIQLYCDKQRNGKWQGLIALWFDENSSQFHERPGTKSLRIVP